MQIVHQSKPVVPRDRLIRLPEVENLVGCKKSTIYAMVKKGTFMRPIRLSARLVVWPETVVLQWLQDRIEQSAASPVQTPVSASTSLSSVHAGGQQ